MWYPFLRHSSFYKFLCLQRNANLSCPQSALSFPVSRGLWRVPLQLPIIFDKISVSHPQRSPPHVFHYLSLHFGWAPLRDFTVVMCTNITLRSPLSCKCGKSRMLVGSVACQSLATWSRSCPCPHAESGVRWWKWGGGWVRWMHKSHCNVSLRMKGV